MVTDKADSEGVESRNDRFGRADGFKTPAGNSAAFVMVRKLRPPGIVGRFESDNKNVR